MALSQEVSGNVTLCRMLVSAVRTRMLFVVNQADYAVLFILLEPDNAVVQVLFQ